MATGSSTTPTGPAVFAPFLVEGPRPRPRLAAVRGSPDWGEFAFATAPGTGRVLNGGKSAWVASSGDSAIRVFAVVSRVFVLFARVLSPLGSGGSCGVVCGFGVVVLSCVEAACSTGCAGVSAAAALVLSVDAIGLYLVFLLFCEAPCGVFSGVRVTCSQCANALGGLSFLVRK
jgi:hypothetical protein